MSTAQVADVKTSQASEERPDEELSRRLTEATHVLEELAENRSLLLALPEEYRRRLVKAAGDVYCPDVQQRRLLNKATHKKRKKEKVARDEKRLNQSGIRSLRRKPVFTTPNFYPPQELPEAEPAPTERATVEEAQNCYICKQDYFQIHSFYDQLCPDCAALNFRKRTETADLSGRIALLTGGRVKIGYQAGIKLLRAGATLIVSTRFPRDAALRYSKEEDFELWRDRLHVYGLDLRHTPSVEAFCQHLLNTLPRLDFIVSNACQTVRRPPEFYRHMMDQESGPLASLPEAAGALLDNYQQLCAGSEATKESLVVPESAPGLSGLTEAAALSQAPLTREDFDVSENLFPSGRLDQDLQQVDLRDRNSWRLLLDEVSSVELLEVQLVNAVAPFVLNARLKPLLTKGPERDRHIVNVSAVEGQFYRKFKTTRHPHTNMAKAALNMMTRTAAADYHAQGIHMNSVDTGWVTDEDPVAIAERKTDQHRFHPPLDIVDGAARIVDPIIDGFNTGDHIWGKFLKDYRPTDW